MTSTSALAEANSMWSISTGATQLVTADFTGGEYIVRGQRAAFGETGETVASA